MSANTRTAALAVSCLVGCLVAAPSASADTPVGVPVSPIVASHVSQKVLPLAGEPHRLVFARVPVLGDGTAETDSASLEDYEGSGTPSLIGITSLGSFTNPEPFSLTGAMLTTDANAMYAHLVQWWNLANHTSGTATTAGVWAGSAADGWYYTKSGKLYDESTSGSVQLVATIFAGNEKLVSASVGPHGVIAVDSMRHVDYVTTAGTVTRLDFNNKPVGYQSLTQCGGTSARETVCVDQPIQQVSDIRLAKPTPKLVADRVPLNGGRPTAVPDLCAGNGISYDDPDFASFPGTGISAAFTSKTLVCADNLVSSIGLAAASHAELATYRVGSAFSDDGSPVVAAFGSAVAASADQDALETIDRASSAPRLLRHAPHAIVTAGGFALTTGRISWVSNPALSASSRALSAYTAPLTAAGDDVTVGPSRLVAQHVAWTEISASGDTTAYSVLTDVDGVLASTVHVVSPYRTTVLTHVRRGTISMSGNRVVYGTTRTPIAARGRYMLLNVDTGKTRPIAAVNAVEDPVSQVPVTLWGSYVLYGGVYDPLERLDLNTGSSIAVTAPGLDPDAFFAHLYGPYVGWFGSRKTGDEVAVFRNVSANGPVVTLPAGTYIDALTNSGVVFGTDTSGPLMSPLDLRGYGASDPSAQILTSSNPTNDAQVDDGLIAWRDASHVLRVAALSVGGITPLSLGAPYAPKTFRPAGKQTWDPTLAFSAALTSCQITIMRSGTLVRTLGCDSTEMSLGDAAVQWDGTDGSGVAVSAAAYTWTAQVEGTSGVMKQLSGSVTVTAG